MENLQFYYPEGFSQDNVYHFFIEHILPLFHYLHSNDLLFKELHVSLYFIKMVETMDLKRFWSDLLAFMFPMIKFTELTSIPNEKDYSGIIPLHQLYNCYTFFEKIEKEHFELIRSCVSSLNSYISTLLKKFTTFKKVRIIVVARNKIPFKKRKLGGKRREKWRYLENIDDIVEKLKEIYGKHEVRKVFLADISFAERCFLFQNAELLIGMSGAGLMSGIFMPNGSGLIEIHHDDWVVYSEQSKLKKMKHVDLIGELKENETGCYFYPTKEIVEFAKKLVPDFFPK